MKKWLKKLWAILKHLLTCAHCRQDIADETVVQGDDEY